MKIIILKLGGGLLTDKNKPLSLRKEVIESAIQQIIESGERLILVHGGGSFGHPIAKKYRISQGLNSTIDNQIAGLAETHDAMNKFNSHIIKIFMEKNYPAISIQPSSIFFKYLDNIYFNSIEIIETLLDLGLVPVLYGDIILDKSGSFSIISGDRIILELCMKLKKYSVSKVIFAIEKDGIFIENETGNVKLALNLNPNELDNINLADLGEKIDVTGGIRGKINAIKEIVKLNVPIQIINGLKNKFILKALNYHQDFKCTNIKVPKKIGSENILSRKLDHLKIPIEYDVQHSKNYFEDIRLIHHSLPEIELDDIDLSVQFFNKKISAPICIAAITGGHPISEKINKILAEAAEKENIIMSVGSQRIGLKIPSTINSFKIVREVAPNIPIIGNIGVGNFSMANFNIVDFDKCIKMINADAMAIHFNALHELVQDKGNKSYKLFSKNFKKIRENTIIPIIAKEVGTGINQDLALMLEKLGFNGYDIGGTGGTSFASIESYRNNFKNDIYTRNPAEVFREWGIPTPVSIMNVRKVSQNLIIATGGLRTGIDIAKSIVLGADIGGFAHNFLVSAWKDYKNEIITNTIKEIKTLKNELRSSLWLMNVKNLSDLKGNSDKRVLLGELFQWINQ
ncbi:MAG: type 2 isopentenyl-diphosphate Delta-isomerase [Promethearchaeota archaeon]